MLPEGVQSSGSTREEPIIAEGARLRRPGGPYPGPLLYGIDYMIATSKKQLTKIQQQKANLRNSLWPNLDESWLWGYKQADGWLNIPRAMPLLLQIMDRLSNGKPISTTYLDLWCRTYNDSFVVANKHREMAFFSGFTGERAEHTWASRIRILANLNFIDLKEGSNGAISYILLWNPYRVIKHHSQQGRVDNRSYNALLDRMIEIGASDLEEPSPSVEASPQAFDTAAAGPALA